jgi:membrane protease YdiL (CAAX protease family)
VWNFVRVEHLTQNSPVAQKLMDLFKERDMEFEPGNRTESERSANSLTARVIEFVAAPIRDASELQRNYLNEHHGFDVRTTTVLALVAILLTLRSYFFHYGDLVWCVGTVATWWEPAFVALEPRNVEFSRLAFWALGQDLLYVLVPVLTIKFVFREQLVDYGLKLRGMFQCAGVYLAMMGLMTPLIVWLSQTESFQSQYPFYRLSPGEPIWPRVIVWELLYATQFVSLEFFFRGFMIHGTKHRFGPYCVLVMMVPYCMIHFSKPLPETFGAILAGIALGLMSLKTRSIWMGAALHITVAWSMDAAALLTS